MKKYLAIILAAAMVFGLASAAMAEDISKTATVKLSGTLGEKFLWTLPTLDLTTGEGTVSASGTLDVTDARLKSGNVIHLSVSTANAADGKDYLKVEGTDSVIPYTLTIGASTDKEQDLTPEEGEGSLAIAISADTSNNFVAGAFKDTITFMVSIAQPMAAQGGENG